MTSFHVFCFDADNLETRIPILQPTKSMQQRYDWDCERVSHPYVVLEYC